MKKYLDKRFRAERPPWLRLLLFAGVLLVYLHAHFRGLSWVSDGLDWGQFELHAAVARISLWRYHEFPAFNPYLCGGYPLIANPQVDMLSPWWALSMLFGEQVGIRLSVFGHLLIAMLGMFAWARSRLLSQTAATGSALAFGLAGFFAAHIGWGHQWALPFAYLPLVMLLYERARRHIPWAIGVGALVALMHYEGGVYPVPMTILLLALRAGIDMLREPRRAHRIAAIGLVAGAVALGLSAPKSFASYIYLTDHPRSVHRRDTLLLSQIIEMFLGRDTAKKAVGYTYNRFEYYAYMGPVVIGALLWSLFRARDRRAREGLLLLALITLLMIGRHGPWSPFELLLKLPFYSQLRVPSRYGILVSLFLALNLGYALDALRRFADRRPRLLPARWWVPLVLLFMVGDLLMLHRQQIAHTAFVDPPAVEIDQPFVWLRGGGDQQYRRVLKNQGSAGCFEGIHIPRGALRLNDPTFAWLDDAGSGSVAIGRWSPSSMHVSVELNRPATVLFNQNCIRGWRVDGADQEPRCLGGLLALDLPAGQREITARYVVPGFRPGLGVLGATLACLGLYFWRRRARGEREKPSS